MSRPPSDRRSHTRSGESALGGRSRVGLASCPGVERCCNDLSVSSRVANGERLAVAQDTPYRAHAAWSRNGVERARRAVEPHSTNQTHSASAVVIRIASTRSHVAMSASRTSASR